MSVAGGVDVRAALVDRGVDCERGGIDGFVAFDNGAVFVYEDEVRDFDLAEVGGEGVEPWFTISLLFHHRCLIGIGMLAKSSQKWSVRIGSLTLIWPATPSS